MKKIVLAILFCILLSTGCEKDNYPLNEIIGKWKLVKEYSPMAQRDYFTDIENQRIEEYTWNNERIRYDYLENEISRCSFSATDSVITVFFVKPNGQKWESSYQYWFINDTLKIRNDGGFEYYDEFFVPIY